MGASNGCVASIFFVFAGNEYAHRAFDEYCRGKEGFGPFSLANGADRGSLSQKWSRTSCTTAAYPITWLNSWDEYEQKLDNWVADAADHGAEFLVFPEYASMELSSLAGEDVAKKWKPRCHRFQRCIRSVARHMRTL